MDIYELLTSFFKSATNRRLRLHSQPADPHYNYNADPDSISRESACQDPTTEKIQIQVPQKVRVGREDGLQDGFQLTGVEELEQHPDVEGRVVREIQHRILRVTELCRRYISFKIHSFHL